MNPKHFTIIKQLILGAFISLLGFGCSSDKATSQEEASTKKVPAAETVAEHGVGPVEHIALPADLDQALVEQGKAIYESKCTACHKFEERYVGPALEGVTERRNPAWIMNMIMVPEEMTKKDPIAKKLLADYMTQMVNQNVIEEDARALLEYFLSVDKNKSI